ncbi:hypothetical protein HU755_14015 [Pseudomonas sp. SWRI111]|uniref:hypothetical protein n=1 Tax=Pseudomonas sp. SWRI111 TaxID=2745507 RepID=UPI0016468DD8|nr:hypothetical protein [Pseudomonas sp. SWRI111]MBC3207913.1 hypothetical protein [Pseudomonas sp. SWRI111]
MNRDDIDPELETDFLKRRLADLQDTHPRDGTLSANLLQVLDYRKTVIRNELQARNMVIALGYTFSREGHDGLPRFEGGLRQFVEDRTLSPEHAAAVTAQASGIWS